MAFRVKDLLINVVPPESAQARPGQPIPYVHPALTLECIGAMFISGNCLATALWKLITCLIHGSIAWPFIAAPIGEYAATSEQLATLKAQLRQALVEIENHEKLIEERSAPQDVAEIEELQSKIREALAELDRRKSELQASGESEKK
jgi:hypothetical protein